MFTNIKKWSLRSQVLVVLLLFVTLILAAFYFYQRYWYTKGYYQAKMQELSAYNVGVKNALIDNDITKIFSLYEQERLNEHICLRLKAQDIYLSGLKNMDYCDIDYLSASQVNTLDKGLDTRNQAQLRLNYKDGVTLIRADRLVINNQNIDIYSSTHVKNLNTTFRLLRQQFFSFSLAIILATLFIGLLVSSFLIKPLKKLAFKARNLASGEFSEIDANNAEMALINQELTNSAQELLNKYKLEGDFMASVTHEFKTPLTMIKGYNELLNNQYPNNYSPIIDQQVEQLNKYVNDILDFNKLKNATFTLVKKPFDLAKLLKQIAHQYHHFDKNVDFKVSLEVKELSVEVDEFRIRQVVTNFIDNAFYHNHQEHKTITLTLKKLSDGYEVSVSDNGGQLNDQQHIFDAYYQADSKLERTYVHSGLGLFISKQILNAHNYQYGVKVVKNESTKFYFIIPK